MWDELLGEFVDLAGAAGQPDYGSLAGDLGGLGGFDAASTYGWGNTPGMDGGAAGANFGISPNWSNPSPSTWQLSDPSAGTFGNFDMGAKVSAPNLQAFGSPQLDFSAGMSGAGPSSTASYAGNQPLNPSAGAQGANGQGPDTARMNGGGQTPGSGMSPVWKSVLEGAAKMGLSAGLGMMGNTGSQPQQQQAPQQQAQPMPQLLTQSAPNPAVQQQPIAPPPGTGASPLYRPRTLGAVQDPSSGLQVDEAKQRLARRGAMFVG